MDVQEERTIQTLEDTLRACINYFNGNWYENFHWWSSHITIIFIHPYPWLLMQLSMVGGVYLLFGGFRLASIRFLVPN